MNTSRRIIFFFLILPAVVLSVLFLHSQASASSASPMVHPVTVLSSDFNQPDSSQRKTNPAQFTPTGTQQLRLSAMGRDYTLNLRNSHLLDNTRILDGSGRPIVRPETLFLQGTVEGDPWSWVRGTWSDGIFTGWIQAFDQLLMIEPSDSQAHSRTSETVMIDITTATAINSFSDEERYAPAGGRLSDRSTTPLIKTPSGQIQRTLRIGIVVDSHYNEIFNNRGLEKALSVINIVNGIYQQEMGVAMTVETAYRFDSTSDPLRSHQGGINTIMSRFRDVRLSLPALPADLTLVHLFTGLPEPKDVLGLGWIDVACRTDGYDVSVSRPYQFDALLTAHEIGHNLGAVHDNNLACSTENRKIMSARLSHTTTAEFSDCSREFMAPLIAASCNLDHLDLAIDLQPKTEITRSDDQTTEHVMSVVIRNRDATRTAASVMVNLQYSGGLQPRQLDSRCHVEENQVTCEINSLAAASDLEINLRLLQEHGQSGELVANLQPQYFSDLVTDNNTASLRLTASDSAAEPVEIKNSQSPGSGGSLFYLLWCLGVINLWRRYKARAI